MAARPTPQMLPQVILVDILAPNASKEDSLARLNELERLIRTYGGLSVARIIQRRQMPDYQTYIGKGKVKEIEEAALAAHVEYVIINNILKPQQIYNLEKIFEKHRIRVWDRIDLILEIFAKHAVTREAKLQIELARMDHLGPRISKMGSELTKQGGGIGTRGLGETNIEIMKRHIANRKQKIRSEIKKIEEVQASQRVKRRESGFKTVSLVGYTNAGKSSLLTALTKKEVKAKDELFSTLDTRLGKLYLPDVQKSCLLGDTIGFIRDLPPELIDAFHSTLAETVNADLILHVIDMDDLDMEKKIETIESVLHKLGCANKKIIYVFNKVDCMQYDFKKECEALYSKHHPVFVSAVEKINLDELKKAIAHKLFGSESENQLAKTKALV